MIVFECYYYNVINLHLLFLLYTKYTSNWNSA